MTKINIILSCLALKKNKHLDSLKCFIETKKLQINFFVPWINRITFVLCPDASSIFNFRYTRAQTLYSASPPWTRPLNTVSECARSDSARMLRRSWGRTVPVSLYCLFASNLPAHPAARGLKLLRVSSLDAASQTSSSPSSSSPSSPSPPSSLPWPSSTSSSSDPWSHEAKSCCFGLVFLSLSFSVCFILSTKVGWGNGERRERMRKRSWGCRFISPTLLFSTLLSVLELFFLSSAVRKHSIPLPLAGRWLLKD